MINQMILILGIALMFSGNAMAQGNDIRIGGGGGKIADRDWDSIGNGRMISGFEMERMHSRLKCFEVAKGLPSHLGPK